MQRLLVLLGLVFGSVGIDLQAAERGAADFRISEETPHNWRGDFHGNFPGATPPTEWDELSGKHIRWRTALPAHGCEAPLVVGDRVIVLSNPCIITCLDAATGEQIWERREFDIVWPRLAELSESEQAAVRQAMTDNIAAQVHQGFRTAKGIVATFEPASTNPEFTAWVQAVRQGDHPNVLGTAAKGDELPWGGKAKTPTYLYKHGELLREHGIEYDANAGRGYMRWTGMLFVPPISDGERVYVRWPGNRWAAYSLTGERLWVSRAAEDRRNTHPGLKWKDPHHGILWAGKLLVPGGVRGGFLVLDPATGKAEKKVEVGFANQGRNYSFVPLVVEGEPTLITRNGIHVTDTFDKGAVVGEGLITGNVGPKGYNRPFGDYGAIQRDDRLYAGFGNYDAKDGCGLKVYRIEPGPTLVLEKKVPLNKASLSERAKQRSKHGRWKADVNWRGLVVGDRHVYFFGASHWVTIVDRQSFEIVDFYQMFEGQADGTTQPFYADGKVYAGNWSGRTGVIDDATGELIAVNLTEPIVSAGFFPRGKQLFVRGLLSVYCIAGE